MATVHLGAFLRELGAPARWTTDQVSVAGLLSELESTYPALRLRLRDERGELLRQVRVLVRGEDVRNSLSLATPIGARDEVEILRATPGG